MNSKFILLFILGLMVFAPTVVQAGLGDIPDEVNVNGVDIELKSRLGLSFSGTFATPSEYFGDSWDKFNGFSFGAGLALVAEENPNIYVGRYLLDISYDKILLQDDLVASINSPDDIEATLIGIHFTTATAIPIILSDHFAISPFLGSAMGASVFTLKNEDYETLGGSTLTELNEENDRLQLSYYSQLGLNISGINHVSLQYSYDLVSVERAWLVWHSALSSISESIAIELIPKVLGKALPDDVTDSLPFQLTVLAYKMGVTWWWYDFNYDNHNWPFDDESPMHFTRHMATLNFNF